MHKADIHPPTTDVAVALIAAADDQDPDFGVFLRRAAATGARRGELCALRSSDIDGASNTMLLARNVIAGDNGGWIEKDTKTHQSRRISLDPATMALLERQRAAGDEVASAAGVARPADAFVFSLAADGAARWLPNHQTHRFRALCRRTGVDGVRLHDFRHMHASQLLGANIDVRTVAGRLGHAYASTTLGVYAQFLQARDAMPHKSSAGCWTVRTAPVLLAPPPARSSGARTPVVSTSATILSSLSPEPCARTFFDDVREEQTLATSSGRGSGRLGRCRGQGPGNGLGNHS